MTIPTELEKLPRLNRPALVNAAEYWMRPSRFIERCQGLGERFIVPMAGSGPWLCLTNPDDAKAVFTADTDVLRLGEALRKVSPHEVVLGPTNLTALDGPEHLTSRRLLLPAFTGEALASYEDVIAEKACEMVDAWPIDKPEQAQRKMLDVTLEIIIAAVFGVTNDKRAERLRAAIQNLLAETETKRFLFQIMFASSGDRGFNRPFRRIARLKHAVDEIVMEEIEERRRSNDHAQDDVLGRLLSSRDEDDRGLGDAELCDTMRLLLIGGHDTTGNTLAWAMERLTRNPEVLARAVQAAHEGDDAYLDAVFFETLRMRPVFPQTVRFVAEPFELGDIVVPQGTMIVVMISMLQMNPEIYADPEKFDPGRFGGKRPGTYTWVPFGGGKRRCIGASMAQLESRVILRELLGRMSARATNTKSERVKRSTVVMVPSEGAKVVLNEASGQGAACPHSRA